MFTRPRRTLPSLALTAALATALTAPLAACSADSPAAETLTVTDPWVKTAESGMTAAFATLTNPTDDDLTVTAATTDSAAMVELHEVVDGVMQERDGGFTVPAGESLTLEPGGLHLMLMELSGPIVAGDTVAFTLELADGSMVDLTATAKDFDGGEEDYEGGMESHSS